MSTDKSKKGNKTYQEIFAFVNAAQQYLAKRKKDGETKFTYALRKVLKASLKLVEAYQEQVEELNIEHCSVDDEKNILKTGSREDNGYVFQKDALKKRNAGRKKLFEATTYVEPFQAQDVPDDLDYDQLEAFAGFVLPDAPKPEALA